MSRLVKSFAFAFNGLKTCLGKEANFKIHIFCTIVAVGAGVFFSISSIEWIAVLLCVGFVLSMEMLNTAIEQLCNIVHKEVHTGIRVIKDVAAGAVLISAIVAAVCGGIIFIPKILFLIKSSS